MLLIVKKCSRRRHSKVLPEDDAVSCEGACNSAGGASTGKDKDSTQEEMACMKEWSPYPILRLDQVLGGS